MAAKKKPAKKPVKKPAPKYGANVREIEARAQATRLHVTPGSAGMKFADQRVDVTGVRDVRKPLGPRYLGGPGVRVSPPVRVEYQDGWGPRQKKR